LVIFANSSPISCKHNRWHGATPLFMSAQKYCVHAPSVLHGAATCRSVTCCDQMGACCVGAFKMLHLSFSWFWWRKCYCDIANIHKIYCARVSYSKHRTTHDKFHRMTHKS
jgi:hypothetical protein